MYLLSLWLAGCFYVNSYIYLSMSTFQLSKLMIDVLIYKKSPTPKPVNILDLFQCITQIINCDFMKTPVMLSVF